MATAPGFRETDTAARRGWTDESDIAVALIRGGFIIAFALTPYALGRRIVPDTFTQTALLVAVAFELALLLSYLRRHPLLLKRPLALIVDICMVTAAIRFFEQLPTVTGGVDLVRPEWLVALYYPVIMVGAIWFRFLGAILVAVTASVLYGLLGLQIPWNSPVLWLGQGPAMILVAVAASYIVLARDRERQQAHRLQHDLSLARGLQEQMLPGELPRVPGVQVAAGFQPARTVGGDLYDAVALGPRRLLVCLGDMAGKSVYGLVHLSLVHSHVQAAARRGLEPAEVAEVVNQGVYDALQPDGYAAFFLAVVNTEARTLTFANCGHLPPLLMRAGDGGEPVELSTGGIVIGAVREPRYQQQVVDFRPGDLLVCYTDGIVEARNRRKEEFGVERIMGAIREHQSAPVEEIARALMDAADEFSADAYADDRTVLVVKAVEEAPAPPEADSEGPDDPADPPEDDDLLGEDG